MKDGMSVIIYVHTSVQKVNSRLCLSPLSLMAHRASIVQIVSTPDLLRASVIYHLDTVPLELLLPYCTVYVKNRDETTPPSAARTTGGYCHGTKKHEKNIMRKLS